MPRTARNAPNVVRHLNLIPKRFLILTQNSTSGKPKRVIQIFKDGESACHVYIGTCHHRRNRATRVTIPQIVTLSPLYNKQIKDHHFRSRLTVCERRDLRLGLTISLNLSVSLSQMSQLLDKAKNFVAEKLANIEKPEACIDGVDFKRLSRESVEYLAKVSVKNPYGHALPICEISYTLKSAGRLI